LIKVELLLAAAPDASVQQSLAAAFHATSGARVTAHDPSLLSGLAHGQETQAAPPFGYLVELAFESEDAAMVQVGSLRDRLDPVGGIDRSASVVVAGKEFTVVAGDEPIMLGMALTRRDGMSRAAFTEYWRTSHADLGRQVPGSEGYRQVHLDETLTDTVAAALGFHGPRFDGMALAYYSTQTAFESIMANAEVTAALLADERTFIDHSRSAMIIGRTAAARRRG
jgi:uncharacterized protein (TIGR02118 family)